MFLTLEGIGIITPIGVSAEQVKVLQNVLAIDSAGRQINQPNAVPRLTMGAARAVLLGRD
jgi:hypothetical protein